MPSLHAPQLGITTGAVQDDHETMTCRAAGLARGRTSTVSAAGDWPCLIVQYPRIRVIATHRSSTQVELDVRNGLAVFRREVEQHHRVEGVFQPAHIGVQQGRSEIRVGGRKWSKPVS